MDEWVESKVEKNKLTKSNTSMLLLTRHYQILRHNRVEIEKMIKTFTQNRIGYMTG